MIFSSQSVTELIYDWLFTVIWDICCVLSFLILGNITEQITASFSFPWISFIRFCLSYKYSLNNCMYLLWLREAQHDVTGKALNLRLRFFCFVLLTCVTLGTACYPRVFSLLLTHICLPLSFGWHFSGQEPCTYSDTVSLWCQAVCRCWFKRNCRSIVE